MNVHCPKCGYCSHCGRSGAPILNEPAPNKAINKDNNSFVEQSIATGLIGVEPPAMVDLHGKKR